jgi:hypothetical protein
MLPLLWYFRGALIKFVTAAKGGIQRVEFSGSVFSSAGFQRLPE